MNEQSKQFIVLAQKSVYASYNFTFDLTGNIDKMNFVVFSLSKSEKSSAKLWKVSCKKTLNHSSFLKITISESGIQVNVNPVLTFFFSKHSPLFSGKCFFLSLK